SIPGKPTVTATTDMEGRFVLEAEPGEATIALIKSGYQTLTGTVEIAAGVTVDIGTAELVPNDLAHYAAITGQVVDAVTGTPLEGVRVAARLEGRYYSDYSDENGDFELRYLSFFSGNVELTLEGYRSIDLGVILTKGEVLDFGVLTMRKEEVDNLLPDIMPQILGKDALTVDAMNYQANGAFHAAITNAGNSPAVGDIEIVAFSDSNDNAVYDEGLDTRLGSKALALSLPVSGSVEFDITVNGQLPFRDAPILLQIDIANTIPEGSENNNTATTAGICSAREDGGIAIDLLLCMDRSGSVGGSNFTMQLEGTAAALEDSSIIPRNGTVRISLLTFSSYTRVEIPPTIVTQSNAETLAQAVRDVRYTAGGTSIHSCLYKAVDVLTSLQQRAEVSVIDLATDGGSCGSCAENASDEAKAAGVDVLNALAVGRGANVALLKRIVYPQPPGGDQGFVVEIEDFEDYAAAIASNMRNETRVSDFSAGNLQLIDNGPGQPVSITLRVGNGGTLTSPAGAVVEFHAVDAGGADTLLGSVVLEPLAGGDYQDIRLDGVESLADAVSVYAIVDPAGVARECNTANNRLETSVSTKLASLQVATDAAVYGPQMPVLLSGQISNEGSLAGNFTVALRIVDNNGNVMAAFVGLDADAVDPGGNTSVTADWNTAHYLAGNYTLEGTLYGEQGEVLDTASADFEIRHTQDESPAITLQVSPDQHEYHTTATAIINSQVVNESTNVLLNDARLAISVASSSGATVFTKTTIMGSLVPQAVRAVADPYAFSDIVQGKYTITGQVLNAAGQVLARDTANFIVNEDKRLSLSGEVTAQYPELFQGDAQLCTAVIHNDGTLNLSSQPVRRLVANLADEQAVQGNEMVITLAAGESRTFMRDVTTGNLALGQHACVLQARINGQWHDLAYDTFKVLEPPVEIIPALTVGNYGRVLVLLDGGCEAHGK
ncbi:MAG TPA: DUF1194 domain-containing protein, partial [Gammaproteobacteria bacterium]|nr:DUF1194 domain-containing protein [Gammaproteobacteria bacterium]